jgi:hypothetical protein
MEKYKNVVFLVLLLLISGATHVFTIMKQRPQSVHMWAMCDRGSIARNYAQESMNFLLPRVHETKQGEGITGLEFPIMNYGAAVCYKIFGFSEFWYRLLMFLVYSGGLYASYLISGIFLKRESYRYLSVFLFSITPILTYYAANFIPDTASFGFMMIAWYFFFSYFKHPSTKRFLFLTLFASLAVLIKLTSAIGVIIMMGLIIWSYIRKKNFELTNLKFSRPLVLLACFIVLGLTYGWYTYAKYLNDTYGLTVFLMKSMRPESWDAIKNVAKHINEIWVQFYFPKAFYYLFLVTIGFILFQIRKVNEQLILIFIGYLFGVLSFVYMMFVQFGDHDYYIITLLPLLFFMFLLAFNTLEKLKINAKFNSGILVVLIALLLFGVKFNRGHQAFRMDEHCWLYDWSRYKDYQTVEPYVKELGLKSTDKVIAILDYSPNIALYFLNLKGWSVADIANDESIQRAMIHKPSFLVVNDLAQLDRPIFKDYPPQKIGQYKSILFYKLIYP